MPNLETHMRQQDLVKLEQLEASITIIGAGGIGSATVLGLAKLGCTNITLWDDDTLEPHNESSQMLPIRGEGGYDDVGMPTLSTYYGWTKASLASILVTEMTSDVAIDIFNTRFTRDDHRALTDITIAAVDSMAVRKDIFESCLENVDVRWFIDGRMSAEGARIYVVDMSKPDQYEYWEKSWFSDDELPDAPCTMRATIYNSMIIGGLITNIVKKIATQDRVPKLLVWDASSFLMAPIY